MLSAESRQLGLEVLSEKIFMEENNKYIVNICYFRIFTNQAAAPEIQLYHQECECPQQEYILWND